ncbi:unnamed protein product [Ectocarpus sp. 4 AP-2014]
MAGLSVSALANLLVSAASVEHGDDTEDTHEKLREATRNGAKRKARVLSKHRAVLARWTASPATGVNPQRQQHNGANGCSTGDSPAAPRYSGTRSSEDLPPVDAVADRSEEVRVQNDIVSPLLSLASTDSVGRHVVAGGGSGAGAIPAGTVLLRETPFAWSLHPEFDGEFCAHCLCEITGPVSLCPECGRVAYCGRACSTAALQEWHGSECLDASSCTPLEPALSGISPTCMVALRAYKRARRQGDQLPKRTDSGKGDAGVAVTVTETQGACQDRFGSVASSPPRSGGDDVAWPKVKLGNLQEHYAARSAGERDLLETEAAVTAVLASGFGSGTDLDADSLGSSGSGRCATRTSNEACELVAAELATTLVKVSTNAFTVSSLRCSAPRAGHNVQPLKHATVAVGLYLVASMMNHSCRPNALASFHGGEMRVVATRAIERGELVTISYGPLASKVSSASERQAYLSRAYFFRCECIACRPPPEETATTPSHRSRGSEGGDERQLTDRDKEGRAIGATFSKRTDFACTEAESGGCPGTLRVGVSPPPPPPFAPPTPPPTTQSCLNSGVESSNVPSPCINRVQAVASLSSTSPSPRRMEVVVLWCDRCGSRVPPDLTDALLKEDKEDRRLWEEAKAATSSSEKGAVRNGGGDDGELQSMPPPRRSRPNTRERSCKSSTTEDRSVNAASSLGSFASSDALSLVVERIRWRDRYLTTTSMRRAVAHDMHARVLASREDFPGAADACARAVSVLKRRFSPEDQELGIEFLKLAELCFNAGWTDKCTAACVKARESLGVCLQPGDEQLKALNTLQALCAAVYHR